jgi:acylphosphatase
VDSFLARVEGRVQAVGFRAWIWSHATRLDLGGYVRNLPDGAVEVAARGSPRALEQLEGMLWRGPPHARVESVHLAWQEIRGPERFEVRP